MHCEFDKNDKKKEKEKKEKTIDNVYYLRDVQQIGGDSWPMVHTCIEFTHLQRRIYFRESKCAVFSIYIV
jgi:hypothetical protein